MKTLISDLTTSSGVIRTFFLLQSKQTALARNGKPYLKTVFADKSGTLKGISWDIAETPCQVDDFVKVEATVEEFDGTLQLKIARMRTTTADDAVDIADFFPCSERDRPGMLIEVQTWANSVDGDLRGLLLAILGDAEVKRLMLNAPAGVSVHHAYRGGLMEHILSLIKGVNAACEWMPGLDHDLLIASAILHDCGKLWELNAERSLRYSVAGRLMGHIAIGVETITRFATDLQISVEEFDRLIHIIVSHHGSKEFGSPVLPATREAVIFHALDFADSKCAAIDAAEKLAAEGDEQTGYLTALGGTAVIERRSNLPVDLADEECHD